MKVHLGSILLTLLVAGSAAGQGWAGSSRLSPFDAGPASSVALSNLLDAANTVFAQGFPDPRSGEYGEIEVEVGELWSGKSAPVKTRGWVLSAQKKSTQRLAICWNGVVYPVTNMGGPVDWHAEATNLNVAPNWRYYEGAAGEARSVFATNALSTRTLLLLRLGETNAGLRSFALSPQFASQQVAPQRGKERASGSAASYDPYLQLAGDWAWALFDRTISTHQRGDEVQALAAARILSATQPKIEAEAEKRGFRRQEYYESSRRGQKRPYLDFLEQLPDLLADLERRAREGPRTGVVQSGLTNLPGQSRRIAALIRDLDSVQARQWGQPGWVNLPDDAIVQALIREGDAAVEPLLDCLETDKRLTRSVGFHRDFFRSRSIVPVRDAASAALRGILEADFRGGAPEMRAYWKRYKPFKLEDRWYEILKDDSAGMGRWLEAASLIARPTNQWSLPGSGYRVEHPAPTNAPVPMPGEVLRGKADPSVSELLARRALEITETNLAAYDLATAAEIGLRLVVWDADAAASVLKTLSERCRVALEYSVSGRAGGLPPWGVLLAKLSLARAEHGDAEGFEDYAAWLKTTRPEQLEYSLAESFAPLGRFPTNAALRAAADELFGNTNSAWSRLPWLRSGFFNPIETDLIRVPAFRRLLARELDRREVCGIVEWRGPNLVSFQLTNVLRQSSSRQLELAASEQPENGAKVELRWCDWIASSLASAKRIPSFNPFTPEEKRDEAILGAKVLLGQP